MGSEHVIDFSEWLYGSHGGTLLRTDPCCPVHADPDLFWDSEKADEKSIIITRSLQNDVMARLFISFVHEDEKVASATQGLLQTELDLREEVFLASDKWQFYAGDLWLQKIKEALSAAEIVILMLSRRSLTRPWVNFEAGGAWLSDKKIIPVCYGNLSKEALPHPYSAIQSVNLRTEPFYLVRSVNHHLNLGAIGGPEAYRGTLAEQGQPMQGAEYDRLAKVLAEFKDLI